LNAQLFAVHAPSGATLEVLAKQLGLVSDDAIEQVERLGNDHQRTAEMVNNLRQRLDDFQQLGRVEQEILTQEFAVSRQKLADVESAVPPRIRGITQQQAKFARSVEQTLAHVRFPDLVAAASARSLGFLGDLVDWSGDGEADLVGARGAALSIDRLQSHYTMASERATHSLAMPTAPAPAGGVALPSAVGQPQEAKNFRGMPVADSALAAQPARRVEPEPPDGPSFSGIPKPSTRITPAMPVSLQGLGENVELF